MKRSPVRSRRTVRRSTTTVLGFLPLVEAFERRQLLASTNFLQGVVLDTANNPIQNAMVTLTELSPTPGTIGTVITGANGAYSFTGLAPGNYQLVETPPTGYTNSSTSDLTGLYQTTLGTNKH